MSANGGSILLRRRRAPSQRNQTSFEDQWARENAKMEARRAHSAAQQQAILGRLQGRPDQKERER